MAQSPFLWGAKGKAMTPQEVARQRALAMQLQSSAVDTSPVGHWSAGAARLVNAFSGMRKDRQAGAAEDEGRAGAKSVIDALLGGGGNVSMSSSGTLAPGQAAMVDSFGAPPATPGMAGGGSFPQGEADPAMPPAPSGGTEQALSFAAKNIGLNEREQGAALKDYMATGGVNLDPATTAWCAAYVNASLGKAGIQGTGSNMARSFLDWGVAADTPQRGDIGVMSRGDPNGPYGHVGFVDGLNPDGTVRLLGGNQGDAVSVQNYSPDAFLGFRRAGDGGGVSASTMGGSPAAGGTSPVMQALLQASSDPWVAQEYGPVLNALMGQEQARQSQAMAQADPMYQLQMQKAQMELQQMQNPTREPIEVGGVLLDPVSYEPIFDSRTQEAPTRLITGQEAIDMGLPPGAYNMGADGKVTAIGGGGTTINNNMPGQDKFDEAFAAGDAKTLSTISDTGMAAQRNIGRIDELDSLLTSNPTGFAAAGKQKLGEWGIATEGLDDLQAAQALVNSLVPEQRQPGSGPMSDADLALFKQSLPRLINQPGGNAQIIGTMRAIAEYDAAGAEIVQKVRSGEMTRSEGFAALQGRVNPLERLKEEAPARGGILPAPPESGATTQVGPPVKRMRYDPVTKTFQ